MRFGILLAVLAACTDRPAPDLEGRNVTECGVWTADCSFMSMPPDEVVACMNEVLKAPSRAGSVKWDFVETLDTEFYKVWFAIDGRGEQWELDRNGHWTKIAECTGTFHATGTGCPTAPITCE